jgi:hypothetical protein
MKDNRRDFIRKAALGSASISAGVGFSAIGTGSLPGFDVVKKDVSSEVKKDEQTFPGWKISFKEPESALIIKNGAVSVQGKLSFVSGGKEWAIVTSRDGVTDRYAFIDLHGDVQGYFIINQDCGHLQFLFYHRTAQSYEGMITFTGKISFLPGSFPCRTRAVKGERVLSMSCGQTDSLLNDSLFSPDSDTALRLDAANLIIGSLNSGLYSFTMSGEIRESSQAMFNIYLDEDYFRERYIPYYHAIDRNRCPTAPTGWMSWNTYFDTATADDNLDEAKVGQKFLLPFGCEIWSIESWQGNSDRLPVSNFYNMNLETSKMKFPKGMKKLAEDIKKLGFRPGIWMAPFGTGSKEFYDAHRDWFLHDKDGKPISSWNGRYTLDPTVTEAREHLKEIFRTASRDWGYEFFKIDGMSGRSHGYCAHLYERPEIRAQFKDPSCPDPFELCIKAFREGVGDDRIILACQGHTSGPEVKYADASRIGADIVSPNEPVKWEGVYNQGSCFLNQAFTHNIVMYADPDTLLVHDLPLEEARVSATVVALPGQLTFFGDRLARLTPEKMKLLQQTLPPADVRPASLYPYFSMLPVWNLHVHNGLMDDYNIVALFNWEDEDKAISFSTGELGADPDADYTLFEFWTKEDLGIMRYSFTMDVPAHSVRLLSMHRKKEIPHWISSDRHIAQAATELKEYKWAGESRTLEGKIRLIATFPLIMRLRVPAGYTFANIECNGVKCMAKIESVEILAVTFLADKTADYPFAARF